MRGTFRSITTALIAASFGLGAVMAVPAQAQHRQAQHRQDRHHQADNRRDDRSYRNDRRHRNGRDYRADRKRSSPSYRSRSYRSPSYRTQTRRPTIIHRYDYNRPDPRYRGYYANNYYRGGYAPMRVTRQTRIYRGRDDRYYCRRQDGTTGLIVGAALGGLLGNHIDQGQSSILGAVLGAGAGALLGREIDRGGVSCR
ncbi:MAG: glycine zipper 2TM domain-containing protein [Sphingobium sp.]